MKRKLYMEIWINNKNQSKRSNLQYRKRDLDPNQNGQLMTAEVILISTVSKWKKNETGVVIVLKIIRTLIMPIVAADDFWVGASESRQRRVTYTIN